MLKSTKILSVVALTGAAALVVAGIAEAQPRRAVPRGGGGRAVVVARPYYNPWFYNGWYGYPYAGWGWGYGYPMMGYPYPPFGYGAYYGSGDVRVQVEPRHTEVFVDGYYAGVVDDFDGTFQRLRVEPGEHEIALYLDGYRSVHQKVYVQPNKTFRIKETMTPLAPGDTPEPRPIAPAPPAEAQGGDADGNAGRPAPNPRPGQRRGRGPDIRVNGDAGSVALRVQPADAEILIDGEPWQGTAGPDRLVIQLSAGEHRIEIRKQGYAPFESTVRVRPGDTTPVNVSLTRQ